VLWDGIFRALFESNKSDIELMAARTQKHWVKAQETSTPAERAEVHRIQQERGGQLALISAALPGHDPDMQESSAFAQRPIEESLPARYAAVGQPPPHPVSMPRADARSRSPRVGPPAAQDVRVTPGGAKDFGPHVRRSRDSSPPLPSSATMGALSLDDPHWAKPIQAPAAYVRMEPGEETELKRVANLWRTPYPPSMASTASGSGSSSTGSSASQAWPTPADSRRRDTGGRWGSWGKGKGRGY